MSDNTATGWQRLDNAAFGTIYGAIMVLSILMAHAGHPAPPLETAVVLFGSVLAITLAKAFAELLSNALEKRERMTRGSWRAAWQHSAPTLVVANVPTALFLAAWQGWLDAETVLMLSQVMSVTLLAVLGARVGWVLDRRVIPALLGAVFAGGIGLLLATLKYVIH